MIYQDGKLIDPNPSGICLCGCKEETKISNITNRYHNIIKGKHKQYIHGHNGKSKEPFYTKKDMGFTSLCWIWNRCIRERGYGVGNAGGKQKPAHVIFYEKYVGNIPEGKEIDHLCRVRSCVNPNHLEPVSSAVNVQRGNLAKLNPDLVRYIRSETGASNKELADELGVDYHSIRNVRIYRTWKNIK